MENPTHDELINRLEACSKINHPDRLWSEQGKVNISISWDGKYDELKNRVEKIEKEIKEQI